MLRPHHIRPAVAFATSGLVLLMLVTAASPAHNGPGKGRPRLAVFPRRLAVARNIAPGDRIERLVELRARGKGRFAAVYFRVRVERRSILGSVLRVAIDRCSGRWRLRHGVYKCRGRRYVVLARRRFLGRARLRRLGPLRNRPAHLRLVLTLPAGAGNALQAKAVRARYSFVGVARR